MAEIAFFITASQKKKFDSADYFGSAMQGTPALQGGAAAQGQEESK